MVICEHRQSITHESACLSHFDTCPSARLASLPCGSGYKRRQSTSSQQIRSTVQIRTSGGAMRFSGPSPLLSALTVLVCSLAVLARPGDRQLLGASDHKYKKGDAVELYANKVGPFQNPR